MPRPTKNPVPPPAGHVWIEEAARRMSVTVPTLYNYRQQDKGPKGIPSPRRLAYSIADIDAYLAERRTQAVNPARLHDARPPEARISRRKPARAAA
ncbi:helix-turn-helix transcriptional regulator [Streptomyces sp. NPDC058466]|uniref:helix-turn-helix transcriptional regulator n=1 Tax=Streptomyces sp. NPDC058466 TaxID=3346512 RepID=UPI00366425BE